MDAIIHETDGIRWFVGTGGRERTELETETIAKILYESEKRFLKQQEKTRNDMDQKTEKMVG